MLDLFACLSAVLFVTSRAVGFVTFWVSRNRAHFDFRAAQALEVTYLQEEWQHRNDLRYPMLAYGTLNALAWLLLAVPLLQVVWWQMAVHACHRDRNATTATSSSSSSSFPSLSSLLGVHNFLVVLIVAGATTEFVSHMLFVGANETAVWLSRDFNLDRWNAPGAEDLDDGEADMIGWRALEVVHWVMRGMLLWIDAAEYLFLGAILTLLYYSVQTTPTSAPFRLSIRWAVLGFCLGLWSLIDFSFHVLRLKDWRVSSGIAFLMSFLSTVVLYPIWLLWMSRQLYLAKKASSTASSAETKEMVEDSAQGSVAQEPSAPAGGEGGSGDGEEDHMLT